MDHIGIDVHKKESQLCILSEDGELSEPRDPHHRPNGSPTSSATGRGPASSSRPRPRASGWRGVWNGSATRSSSPTRTSPRCTPTRTSQDQDRSARRAGAGRGLPAGGLPPGPSALRRPAPCARAPDGARRPGAHPHRLHQRDPRPAPAARLAGADRQCRGVHPPGPRPGAARPPALGARPPARGDAPGQPAARVLGRADRGRRAGRRTRASGCRPSPASGRSRPPPSWPRSTTPGASRGPIRSRPTWAWCPASGARARANGAGGSPRRAIGACAGCWSRPRCRSCACGTPRTAALREWAVAPRRTPGPVHRRRRVGAAPGRDPLRACSATAPGTSPHGSGPRRARSGSAA